MKTTINGTIVEIFSGACVLDVLRVWSLNSCSTAAIGYLTITDVNGNEVELDGAVTEGCEFHVKEISENDSE